MPITDARDADLPAIASIYAHHVLHGAGTFDATPPEVTTLATRWRAGTDAGHAWLVAREADSILGFAYYGPFRDRAAYARTVEDSVYVREDVRGQGVGKALVAALLAHAEAAGHRQMLALIGDSANVQSVGVHASLGFRQVGTLREVGFKFGRWLDVVIMQRTLGTAT